MAGSYRTESGHVRAGVYLGHARLVSRLPADERGMTSLMLTPVGNGNVGVIHQFAGSSSDEIYPPRAIHIIFFLSHGLEELWWSLSLSFATRPMVAGWRVRTPGLWNTTHAIKRI
jgi:hypothetical protein